MKTKLVATRKNLERIWERLCEDAHARGRAAPRFDTVVKLCINAECAHLASAALNLVGVKNKKITSFDPVLSSLGKIISMFELNGGRNK